MVVSGDKDLSDRVRLLRTHGAQPQYLHKIIGFNSRLDELQAAILRVKLRHLERWTKARQQVAGEYKKKFQAAGLLDRITLPEVLPDRVHVFHQFVIRCRRRDELRAFLRERGIETEIYYPVPLHEQECFRCLGYQESDFPQAHAASRQVLALPIYPELIGEQIDSVVSSIADFYARSST
jgi:dTDP-4-amino-4,6-dideoxygalactose transaminase